MLHLDQQFTHNVWHVLAQQHTYVRIEFVHLAHGVHAQTVFTDTAVIAQTGGAVVAGARGYL